MFHSNDTFDKHKKNLEVGTEAQQQKQEVY